MRVLAAGLNTHHQISSEDEDVRTLAVLHEDADRVLLATWSNIIVSQNGRLSSTGFQKVKHGVSRTNWHSAIGDHNGLIAVIDDTDTIHVVEDASTSSPAFNSEATLSKLERVDGGNRTQYSHLAMAGNERVVGTVQHDCDHNDSQQIVEWSTFDDFRASFEESPTQRQQAKVLQAPGKARQLLAGTGVFAMLNQDGEIYTWGDPRHQSLARGITGEDAKPADQPGLVDALQGIKLKKACLGGWMGGAVSEDGAAYIWGAGQPGDPIIEGLAGLRTSGEKVALIQLAFDDDEEPDVVDMAIGSGHVALITSNGEMYVAGDNTDGQLGLGLDDAFVAGWRKVSDVTNAIQVVCGPGCTIVLQEL